MNRDQVPVGMHVAIPTKGSDVLHEGQYTHRCEKCCAVAAQLVRDHMPRFEGKVINLGDAVRFKPEHLMSFTPEWATITEIRLNSYTGEVWMHSFGSNLVLTDDMVAEVKSWL